MTKEGFLDRYNHVRTVEEALNKSISASVQHNRLYNDVPNEHRFRIRYFWREKLQQLSENFNDEQWSEDKYEDEIEKLKYLMNQKFGNLIDFRISHSQKSISVFFKHLWCLEKIPIPPQCPVDRIILTRANTPYNERSWGFVNDINTHRRKYDLIRHAASAAGYQQVSEWELLNFE